MSFDAVPVPAIFANTILPNLEASHLADGGDPFGPVQVKIFHRSYDYFIFELTLHKMCQTISLTDLM